MFAAIGLAIVGGTAKAKQRGGRGPVQKGKVGVDRALADLKARGHRVVSSREITVETAGGRRKYDAVVEDPHGRLCGVECKNGDTARKDANQRARDAEVNRGDSNRAVGGNARAAGIEGRKVDKVIDVCYDSSGIQRPC